MASMPASYLQSIDEVYGCNVREHAKRWERIGMAKYYVFTPGQKLHKRGKKGRPRRKPPRARRHSRKL